MGNIRWGYASQGLLGKIHSAGGRFLLATRLDLDGRCGWYLFREARLKTGLAGRLYFLERDQLNEIALFSSRRFPGGTIFSMLCLLVNDSL